MPSPWDGKIPARGVVLFSGYAPGFIGLYQINVRVNENAPVGSAVALDVVVDGVPSQTSRIAVR